MRSPHRMYTDPQSVMVYPAGEQSRIDHLVFVVHGIGEHHDLSFRCLVDCGRCFASYPVCLLYHLPCMFLS